MSKWSHSEQKIKFNTRIHAEKRWDEFVAIREQLKREDVSASKAWRLAARHFPPLDGSPHEVDFSDLPPLPGSPAAVAAAAKQKAKPSLSPAADGDWYIDGAATYSDEDSQQPVADVVAKSSIPVPPPAPKSGGWTDYAKATKEGLDNQQREEKGTLDEWRALFNSVPADRRAGTREIADWVFNNSDSHPGGIDADKVPCRGAVRLLRSIQDSAANYQEFIRTLWSKTMPTKSQLDHEGRATDGSKRVLSRMLQFEQSLRGTATAISHAPSAASDGDDGSE
jgi:hypothetical protein